jgi:hypothetical protein
VNVGQHRLLGYTVRRIDCSGRSYCFVCFPARRENQHTPLGHNTETEGATPQRVLSIIVPLAQSYTDTLVAPSSRIVPSGLMSSPTLIRRDEMIPASLRHASYWDSQADVIALVDPIPQPPCPFVHDSIFPTLPLLLEDKGSLRNDEHGVFRLGDRFRVRSSAPRPSWPVHTMSESGLRSWRWITSVGLRMKHYGGSPSPSRSHVGGSTGLGRSAGVTGRSWRCEASRAESRTQQHWKNATNRNS